VSFAYWCILAAALLPYLFTGLAKSSSRFDNRAPRDYLAATGGWRKRAHWAQLNGFEAFPPFAAGVLVAQQVQAPAASVNWLAGLFILFRLLHGLLYIADRATLRSLAWLGGIICVVGLFVAAASA